MGLFSTDGWITQQKIIQRTLLKMIEKSLNSHPCSFEYGLSTQYFRIHYNNILRCQHT